MPPARITPKAEETGQKILESALTLFREEGFDKATMRDIAAKAGVATGAAYYYYSSKDAIVMEFYQRSFEEMQPKIEAAIARTRGLEARLRELIRVKLVHFTPNRGVLRALLRNGADPAYPLSPFSPETAEIREIDIAWFRSILVDCGMRIPGDLESHLPGVLWLFQMGVILSGSSMIRPARRAPGSCWNSPPGALPRSSGFRRCRSCGRCERTRCN